MAGLLAMVDPAEAEAVGQRSKPVALVALVAVVVGLTLRIAAVEAASGAVLVVTAPPQAAAAVGSLVDH